MKKKKKKPRAEILYNERFEFRVACSQSCVTPQLKSKRRSGVT